ncbi:acyl-CoA reductase [Sphingobacterium griseoflavum]|uniref:Acyl-CoA reductase n=1 Tax=Sphingobacterium griseoflavum TaxID=1474952 RepID=A0ABQ3I026_9SPHI|nr:acyl-CoA reductase [Sphingobacterium griseoflavum]GHE36278.1 acyl-CoA reductase [Sphingobacterium griseoflavum]
MTKKQRIDAFAALGTFLQSGHPDLEIAIAQAAIRNPWYTEANTRKQLAAIAANLKVDLLSEWMAPYPDLDSDKVVGLVLAGNIPLVGFQDILSVLLSGFSARIKISSDDVGLTKFVVDKLITIDPHFADKLQIVDKLTHYDLIIATGSDNSARYFEHYFGKKPHIIRKNRNSVAILTGEESKEELHALGRDIFDYFGLGCRSVSKLYVPQGFAFDRFFEAIEPFHAVRDHSKYSNNYDYNKSIYLINREAHLDNGFMLLKYDERLASPLAVVFYETYDTQAELLRRLQGQADKIQCLVCRDPMDTAIPCFPLGESQQPGLTDYADGIDVLAFLFAHV